MSTKTLYLVNIEFRYRDYSKEEDRLTQHSKTVTIGIYNSYEDAKKAGNAMLEKELESRFPLNKNRNNKNRFGETYTKYLISDLAYLTTPFSFFASIKELKLDSVGETIETILESEKRYREGRNKID